MLKTLGLVLILLALTACAEMPPGCADCGHPGHPLPYNP